LLFAALLAAGCNHGASPPDPAPSAQRDFTFAVLGDNRGGYDGWIAPVFRQIVQSIAAERPELVVNTGDMICGRADEPLLRKQWDAYKDAISALKMPVYHVPGNHDIEDAASARLWREYWGKTYYCFDWAGCRFIILDTETDEARIGQAQFKWLKQQLDSAAARPVFIFLHRPLFPCGIYVGYSLDAFPEERDRLHRLFLRHRQRIAAVFMGHEHQYHHEQRDGIRYYITGGAGAPPYASEKEGGFYHYLLVHVAGHQVSVEVRKIAADDDAEGTAAQKRLLDGWERLKHRLPTGAK